MKMNHKTVGPGTAETVRKRIESGGERVWRLADFTGMPFMAVAQTLSRLARQGVIQRLGKGLYYRPRLTPFGESLPNSAQIRALPIRLKKAFPAGVAAANLLGFTTQNPARIELATNGSSLPRLIVGKETVVHTRRPDSWQTLSETDGALLDFLRNRGTHSELPADETVKKLLGYFVEKGRFERLLKVAQAEPPGREARSCAGAPGPTDTAGLPGARRTAAGESIYGFA